jgi:hypothetical protein
MIGALTTREQDCYHLLLNKFGLKISTGKHFIKKDTGNYCEKLFRLRTVRGMVSKHTSQLDGVHNRPVPSISRSVFGLKWGLKRSFIQSVVPFGCIPLRSLASPHNFADETPAWMKVPLLIDTLSREFSHCRRVIKRTV